MKTKQIFGAIMLLLILPFVTSCEKQDKGNARVAFQAINSRSTLKSTPAANVVINSFIVNVDEIEFEFDDDDDDKYPDGESYSELELKGPFEIDLVKNGNTQLTNLVTGVELPQARFDEIEFEFEKSEIRTSELFGKSILVRGTIKGVPFEYFSTIDEFEVEVEFEPPVDLTVAGGVSVVVSIDLATIFDPLRGGVDISNATDANGNGTIEINPFDNDGNRSLASRLDDAIWNAIDSIEERWDD